MEVQQHTVIAIKALADNYIWAIVNESNKTCAIVDPGEATPVLVFLQQQALKLSAILITHHHWDHTSGIMDIIRQHPNTIVYGPAQERVGGMTHLVNGGDTVKLPDLGLSFEVLDIPGHTLGHIAFHGDDMLFCGDTLFTAGCGKIFEGTAEQMHKSLTKLCDLPDDTQIYCGHEYTENNLKFALAVEPDNQEIQARAKQVSQARLNNQPTVPGDLLTEKRTNPFLRIKQQSVINAVEQHSGQPMHNDIEVLQTLREWKNRDY